jgi:hypothetical protein
MNICDENKFIFGCAIVLFSNDDAQAFVMCSLWYAFLHEPGILLHTDRAKIMLNSYNIVRSRDVKSRTCDTI